MLLGNDTYCLNCGEQLAGFKGLARISKPYIKVTAGHLRLVERKGNRWHYLSAHSNPKAELIFCSGACLQDNFEKQRYLKEQYHQVYKGTASDRKYGFINKLKGWFN
jgi:hypothetical protein